MAKKFDTESVASKFFTQPAALENQSENTKVCNKKPAEPKQEDDKKPTKNTRLNLLLYPQLKDDLKELAGFNRTSVNDLINKVLEEYVEEHRAEIEKYKEFHK